MTFRAWVGLLVVLTACSPAVVERSYSMPVQKVSFARSVGAAQPLTVSLEVPIGSCARFKTIRVKRSAGELRLSAVGSRPDLDANRRLGREVICTTAPLVWTTVTYQDQGQPPRTNPFEIVVNGKSRGMVEVK